MATYLVDVLGQEAYTKYGVAIHVPLKMIISDPAKLADRMVDSVLQSLMSFIIYFSVKILKV